MNIVLLGPPGVGKGTVSKKLSEKLTVPHIATGDMLRENVAKRTDLGLQAKTFMDSGKLVPDKLVIAMIQERLERNDCRNGFILDGFPRTVQQADAIAKTVSIQKVINLQAADTIIIDRLSRRRICEKCDFIYHLEYIKPNREGLCDKCDGTLYQREDDRPEAIKKRLEIYREQTKPLIEYYRKKNILIDVDGSGTPEAVFVLVEKAVTA